MDFNNLQRKIVAVWGVCLSVGILAEKNPPNENYLILLHTLMHVY